MGVCVKRKVVLLLNNKNLNLAFASVPTSSATTVATLSPNPPADPTFLHELIARWLTEDLQEEDWDLDRVDPDPRVFPYPPREVLPSHPSTPSTLGTSNPVPTPVPSTTIPLPRGSPSGTRTRGSEGISVPIARYTLPLFNPHHAQRRGWTRIPFSDLTHLRAGIAYPGTRFHTRVRQRFEDRRRERELGRRAGNRLRLRRERVDRGSH